MLSKVYTGALYGLESRIVAVETDLSQGLPSITIVGLADITVREAKERIRAAILNSGFQFPAKRITINLSPANTKKEGSHFDLPIALGVMASIGVLEEQRMQEYAFIGELSLDGRLNRVEGALPLILEFARNGIQKIVLPKENRQEGMLVKDVEVYPAEDLREVIGHFTGAKKLPTCKGNGNIHYSLKEYHMDYNEVMGQESTKRAVTICCAGAHGLFLTGPPGAGKSMIAKRIPTIMPVMTYEECLEVTKIYSISGGLSEETPLITERPFRAPHHTISGAALIGGGGKPKPGEMSLAHLGVLFLDELPEFRKNVLEMLRQPLEEGNVTIARMGGTFSFPCDVMLIAASNPCPCGYFGHGAQECLCTQNQLNHYRAKISGPILDRIDLHMEVFPVAYGDLSKEDRKNCLSSAEMREDVEKARKRQLYRYRGDGISCNAQLTPTLMKKYCFLNKEGKLLMEESFRKLSLSARAYGKIIKIARTIADLEESEDIKSDHVAEAIRYRLHGK